MPETAILILAAGNSSRMGSIKQLLPYKNTTLLGWTIKNAQKTNVNAVFCVLGANAEIIKKEIEEPNINIIYNPNFNTGLSSSIIAGINFLEDKNFDAVLIVLADQPKITSTYLNELLKTSEENSTKIIASNYGENAGIPAIFPKKYFKELLLLNGDKGASKLLTSSEKQIIKLKCNDLTDIDTNEDYMTLIN